MSVQSELVQQTIVETICERVRARSPDDLVHGGYLARVVEAELFEPARAPMPGLAERLRSSPAEDVARELASREPLERPDPDDPDAASWRVPGPGGHVRHYVARRLAGDAAPAELKRDFMYGFLMRCCEEAVSGD